MEKFYFETCDIRIKIFFQVVASMCKKILLFHTTKILSCKCQIAKNKNFSTCKILTIILIKPNFLL